MNIKMFEKIISGCIDNGTINAEDKEIYEYGLNHIAAMFLNVLTTMIISFIFGMVWQSILFMISYIPLRSYAGGYHARTKLGCYLFSTILVICVLLSIKYLSYNKIFLLSMTFISGAIILIFAPIGDKNKSLDKIEIKVFKKRTKITLFVEIGLIFLLIAMNLNFIAICIITSMILAGFMILIPVLFKKFF